MQEPQFEIQAGRTGEATSYFTRVNASVGSAAPCFCPARDSVRGAGHLVAVREHPIPCSHRIHAMRRRFYTTADRMKATGDRLNLVRRTVFSIAGRIHSIAPRMNSTVRSNSCDPPSHESRLEDSESDRRSQRTSPYSSICAPSSITWFAGRQKKVDALDELRIIQEKSFSRQSAMPGRLVGISVSRPRK